MIALVLVALAGADELVLETLSVGGVERTFYVHEPKAATNPPLLLVFHGGATAGATKGKGMARFTQLDRVADERGFFVVYPNSVSGNWNDGRVFDDAATVDDVGFVDAILAHYAGRVDAKRIYAAGMSNGGFLTLRLACERADRFAGFAAVAAALPTTLECKPSAPVSLLLMPGTKDPWIKWDGGVVARNRGMSRSVAETLAVFQAVDHCPPAGKGTMLPNTDKKDGTRIRETRTTCDAGTEVMLTTVEGGGHEWPGTEPYMPDSIMGRTSHDLDGSAYIWAFLSSHSR